MPSGSRERAPTGVPVNLTVRALAEDFLARRYPTNTIRRAKVAALLEAHALPRIGGMPVAAVKREHCVQLVQATLVERRVEAKGSVRRGGRAPAEALCRVLRQLFRDAVKTGRLETLAHSPAELLDPRDFGIPPPRSRDRALSDEEMALLLTHPDIDLPGLLAGAAYRGLLSQSVRVAILLGPFLAVRPIAMLGMRWDELDLEKATWTVGGGRGAKLRHHHSGGRQAVRRAALRDPAGRPEGPENKPHGGLRARGDAEEGPHLRRRLRGRDDAAHPEGRTPPASGWPCAAARCAADVRLDGDSARGRAVRRRAVPSALAGEGLGHVPGRRQPRAAARGPCAGG